MIKLNNTWSYDSHSGCGVYDGSYHAHGPGAGCGQGDDGFADGDGIGGDDGLGESYDPSPHVDEVTA